jgi:hypothetical protein
MNPYIRRLWLLKDFYFKCNLVELQGGKIGGRGREKRGARKTPIFTSDSKVLTEE